MNLRTLLDGTKIDEDTLLSTVPRVLAVDYPQLAHSTVGDEYDADFGGQSLPDWLSYVADDGNTSPTFDGIGSSTVSLDAGSGTVSAVQTGPINWDNWGGVHIYADFSSYSNKAGIAFGDSKDFDGVSNGFKITADSGNGIFQRVLDGGSSLNSAGAALNEYDNLDTVPSRFGLSIEEGPDGNGHNVRFYFAGQLSDEWIESDGFAPANEYNISVGTRNGTAELDRFLLILVP